MAESSHFMCAFSHAALVVGSFSAVKPGAAKARPRPADDEAVLAKFLNGQTNIAYPAGQTISVTTDKLTCRASNVDLTSHSCEISFGTKTVMLSGRRAHELYATLAEIGVAPDGAAGSTFEALSNLKCTIDPNEVKQKSGGGAHCDYSPPN